MQRHQAEILVGLRLSRPVQRVAQIQHPADVAGRDFRTFEYSAAFRGHVLVLRERPFDLTGAELPFVVLAQIILLRPTTVLRRVLVDRRRLATLQIHVLAIGRRFVLVLETVKSVEDNPVATRRFALVEGHVVVGGAVVISALLVRQQVAAGDLGSAIQISAVVRRETVQVVVELWTFTVHTGVRVDLVILQLFLLGAFYFHVIVLRPAGAVLVAGRPVARGRAGMILPLAVAARAEARAPTLRRPLATLIRRRRVAGPAALDAIAADVTLAESPLVQETTVHAVERALGIVLI